MSQIRVRFAPSPTGHFHIGGVRTALFNYLYAKSQKGNFLIRIEDTDQERSESRYEEEILSGLSWLGLDWDEKPVLQSHRINKYQELAKRLVEEGKAYKDPEGTPAIYFKVPQKTIKFYDLVHEPIESDASLFDDFVILKSDGGPSFHFACVVDDVRMKISHVIRGNDHITNTARQVLLYEALNEKPPKFAHLPLILNEAGKPLSKREGGGSLEFYIRKGFLPEGLLNYLALLGWGPGSNEEFFTKEDLIKKFSIKRINKSATNISMDKLRYINGLHLKQISEKEFVNHIKLFYKREVEDEYAISEEDFVKCSLIYRDRIKSFDEILAEGKFYFEKAIDRNESAVQKYFTPDAKEKLKLYVNDLQFANFDCVRALEDHLRSEAEKLDLKAGDLIHPIRVALTGKTVSPGLFDIMKLLGRERTINRINEML